MDSKNRGGRKIDPNSICQRAKRAGLNTATVHARIKAGWTMERALATQVVKREVNISELARRANLHPATVYKRISRHGMSLQQALRYRVSGNRVTLPALTKEKPRDEAGL